MGTEREKICSCVNDLLQPERREAALAELSRNRENLTELAPILWQTTSVMAVLYSLFRLQEIVCVYPLLSPQSLTISASNRICNVLALLQCVAAHPETRPGFLKAQIPIFLFPFLNTVTKTRPMDYLRLTSLGVIGALVKSDSAEVTRFLLQTEIIPLCLKIMEKGNELSKTVATFILHKIMTDDDGLKYLCYTYDRIALICGALGAMVEEMQKEQSQRLLKHIVRCYLRLAEDATARELLKTKFLPQVLRDVNCPVVADEHTRRWLATLHLSLGLLQYE